jgi:hypothetical protein
MKQNKQINQKDIKTILRYASDLPSLESEFRGIANTVLDLEINSLTFSCIESIICLSILITS